MAGVGGFISDLFGSTNKFRATQAKTDPNAYQYGGHPGGADAAANRYQGQAEGAQTRGGVNVDYSQAQDDRVMQQQARQGQVGLAGAMQARAMGQTPSIAQMQADRQMQQAQAAQSSASAGARGPAGIALAQQNAANNTATAQSQISNQAQINAAQERQQAEQAAMGAYGAIRGQDLASQGQSAQQGQFQGSLNAQQRGMNDAMTLGMTNNEMGVRNSQLTAGMNKQAQDSANYNATQSINSGVAGQNAAMNQQNGMGAVSAIGSIAGMAAMSDERAKTNVADFVSSTWGAGRGVQPETIAAQDKALDERWKGIGERDKERDARIDPPGGAAGGWALPGMSPGVRDPGDKSKYMTAAQPLQQRDQEALMLAKAKDAEGADMSDEEQRQLGGAQFRSNNDKKAMGKNPAMAQGGLAGAMSKTSDNLGKLAASVDTSFHAPNTYSAPQLIPLQSGIEMKTGLRPLSERGINPTMTSDPRAKELAFQEGKRAGAVEAHQSVQNSEVRARDADEAQAGKQLLHSMTSPAYLPAALTRAWMSAPHNEGAKDAAERAKLAGRVPSTVKKEPKRALVIEHGADHEGVPSKAMTEEEMFTRPSELRAPVQWDYNFAQPVAMGGAQGGMQTSDERTKNVDAQRVDNGPLANAARSMSGAEYEYKGPFTPPDQQPGEKNVGPMANNMAKDPVAGTIVKRDPSIDLPGGGLVLDQGKMVKTLGAIVADLQKQQDEDRSTIATLSSRMRPRSGR